MILKQNNKTSQILKLLNEGRDSYRGLLKIMGEQKTLAEKEDEPGLIAVIEKKNTLMETAQEIDQKVAEQFQTLSKTDQEKLAKEAENVRKEIESLLEQIIGIEDECQVILSRRQSTLLDKLNELRRGKVLAKGYGLPTRIKPKVSKSV